MARRLAGRHGPPPSSAVPWQECWAKTTPDGRPGTSVREHCLVVGYVAEALSAFLGRSVRGLLPDGIPGLAGLHDVGKVSPGFLQKCLLWWRDALARYPSLANLREGLDSRHAGIGEGAVHHWYEAGMPGSACGPAMVVGAHHGERDPRPHRDSAASSGGEAWARERQGLIQALTAELGPPCRDIPAALLDVVCGLVTVADWIGSDEDYFPTDVPLHRDSLPTRCAEALRACGWRRPDVRRSLSFGDVFGHGFRPRPAQQAFIDSVTGPGLYFLEAPMGEGKTEAALYAAYRLLAAGHHSGLYFGLPTRLTSDRIHTRVRAFLEAVCLDPESGAMLAHGTAWLKAFEAGGEAFRPGGEWFHARKRGLLYPFAVGTIDQALLSVLNVRHAYVRAFGLAGKVVILDEVHTYDSYTGTLLDRLVRNLLDHGSTVFVLSATLSGERLRQIGDLPASSAPVVAPYPLVTAVHEGRPESFSPPPSSAARELAVRFLHPDDNAVAEEAVEAAMAGACVVCIANTVGRAQRWYNAVLARMPARAFEVGLLHSKFTAERRGEIEDRWMGLLGPPVPGSESRPTGCILVATQVVEQSVDIDADLMFTELAPTDMLLQRAGRLWRHQREQRPCIRPELCIVGAPLDQVGSHDDLLEALAESAFVYAPYVLWRSHAIWQRRQSVRLPADIRQLVEDTYAPHADEPPFATALKQDLERRCRELRMHAVAAMSDGLPTRSDDEQAAPTRWSDRHTLNALLVREWDDLGGTGTITMLDGTVRRADANRPDFPLTRELHANLVSVPAWMFPQARTPQALRLHFALGDPVPVLVVGPEGVLAYDGHPTPLAYDGRRGLQRTRQEQRDTSRALTIDTESDPMEDFIDELDW